MLDLLEARSLFAGTVQLDPNGTLRVEGDASDNRVILRQVEAAISVTVDGVESTFPLANVAVVRINTGDGNDTVDALTSRPAHITGGSGSDTLLGGPAVDTLDGGLGGDFLDGRGADDVINVSGGPAGGVTPSFDLLGFDDRLRWGLSQGEGEFDTFEPPVGTLTINLTRFDDSFSFGTSVEYPGGALVVNGGDGNDSFFFPGLSNAEPSPEPADVSLVGGAGNDTFVLLGRDGLKFIDGGEGDDFIDDRAFAGGTAAVPIDLGPGYDTHDCSAENISGEGTSVFRAGAGVEAFFGPSGIGNYTLIGNELDNFLTAAVIESVTVLGMGGDDYIEAMPQSSEARASLDGGAGDDEFLSGFPFSTIVGGAGNDTVTASGQDSITGDEGNDRLMSPGGGPDTLLAGEGNDLIYAADGERDTIDGGPGRDYAQVDGGRGGDVVSNVEKIDARPSRLSALGLAFSTRRVAAGVLAEGDTDALVGNS